MNIKYIRYNIIAILKYNILYNLNWKQNKIKLCLTKKWNKFKLLKNLKE
jgi:hypothetical protein